MSKFLLTTALLGVALSATAQAPALAPTPSWAVGVEASRYLAGTVPDQARVQVLPGLFVRYQPNRLGGWAGLDFGQQTTDPNPANCADCLTGLTTARTLALRLGGQYAVLPQLPWLYTLLDVAYHHTRAGGRYTGGFCGCLDNSTTQTTRTLGASAGIGASFRLVCRIYVGSELYYAGFVGRTSSLTIDNRFGSESNSSGPARGHAPAVRLQAGVTF